MATFERIAGPECPACGCLDSGVISRGQRWGRAYARRRCRHCGRVFSAAEEPAEAGAGEGAATAPARGNGRPAVYHAVRCRCPSCGAVNPRVTSTPRRGLRHHKCQDCGHTFKSFEE